MTAWSSGKTSMAMDSQPTAPAGMNTRRLFAQFTEEEILLEQGRLLFSLLNAFVRGGYTVCLFDNHTTEALGKYGSLVLGLDGVTLTKVMPEDTTGWIYLYDREDRATGKRPWRRKLRVRFDLFSPYWFSAPIVMPFPMHPQQAGTRSGELAIHRSTQRQMRVFFSGDSKGYNRNRVRFPKPKLPRLEVIQSIMQQPDEAVLILQNPATLKDPDSSTHRGKIVIADPEGTWIDPDEWLATLALSDFFLSPPGIVMPMCHNIVEAMAVGTIPITNYPEWFVPPLEDMHNCIVFDDHDDLIAKLRLAMDMPATEIARMKNHVIDYYENQLRPEILVRRIESRPDKKITVLMYTERNMALNSKRLGQHSVLFRRAGAGGKPTWKQLITARLAKQ
jgi:hypothetical protein